jgi:tRNA U34 5-carboxymethylaminomethyl modifying enzyme MnmG/GidA
MARALKTPRALTLDDLRGQPGLSRAACDALLALQPRTLRQALRIRGVGRKTAHRLLALGVLTDPEGLQNRKLTLEDLRGK